jgi:homoserine kinase type II
VITTHQGKAVMLKSYIVGQVVRNLDENMLQQMGMALARLHQLPVPDFLHARPPYGLEELPQVVGQNIDPEYEAWVASRFARLERKIPPGLPRGLIHGDLFYDNVLFASQELQALIDFGEAMDYYHTHDLGMSIVGSCRKGTELELDKARALVAGYEKVRRLEEREKETLQLFVEYAATAVSCWRFWKYHVDTHLPDKANEHQTMVRLAKRVRVIPQTQFAGSIFGSDTDH